MALKEQLDADLKSAMRDKDTVKLSVVRMLKSAIKYREIEVMKPLDDAGVLQVIYRGDQAPQGLGRAVPGRQPHRTWSTRRRRRSPSSRPGSPPS